MVSELSESVGLPDDWKVAKCSAVFKVGNRNKVTYYRLISPSPVSCVRSSRQQSGTRLLIY